MTVKNYSGYHKFIGSFSGMLCACLIISSFLTILNCSVNKNGVSAKNGEYTIPPVADSISAELYRYQNTRAASLAGWLPDNSGILILTRFGETNQLHYVKTPGGARTQVTFRSEEIIEPVICPDSSKKTVLFTQDSGGNEQFNIYSLDLSTMQTTRLTGGSGQNNGMVFSNRGDRFIYQSTRRNGRDWDLYIRTMGRMDDSAPVLSEGGAWQALDWSADDSRILVSHYISMSRSYLYVFDVASKNLTPLHDTTTDVYQEYAMWSADGNGIFLTSDENTNFTCLRYLDIKSAKETVITESIPWNVVEMCMSKDRSRCAFVTNENGYLKPWILNTKTLEYEKIINLPDGMINGLSFASSGEKLGFSIRQSDRTGDVFTFDIRTEKLEQWTFSEMGEIDRTKLVSPTLVFYPTFDSVNGCARTIPCFYYKPHGNGKHPVLIHIHGGPETQFWPSFSSSIQYYVNELGVAVLAPDVRGSGGFGKAYLALDNEYKRENAVRDIGELIDWIGMQPELDSGRIAVFGGSYGGYMSLSSMIHYGDRIRAGIDLYGISNYITFLEKTAGYRRDLRRVEYGDERNPDMREFLKKISPLSSASKIHCPLLIVQGANDPRVPAYESEQIADAVRKNGNEVWFLKLGDEGHGIRKKGNRDYEEGVIALFLKKYLLND